MKKFIIAAITVITLATSAIAADTNDKAMNLFKAAYPGAEKVHYKAVGELVSITFQLEGTSMQAFYNAEGEQVAVSRVIDYKKLPLRAVTTLENKFNGYTATEVIEMDHSTEGTSYYVSLVNDSQKVIAQVSMNGEVSVFKKSAK
ncbi:opacity protein-like surface antigen [Filimonas zeae]|uniref:Beta-lactamase-inhibitor-like PepSY-like domain-containing protein n=1 Tax=Filimonas zeae TaxID=1737353 RepID=A0A917MYE8_9BACT|nr:hypothetical protein [Filimonas zeae]MDR6340904.1 opacity protein-like surface antigen [Filimonas zeae]GGH78002.1 hypothetical protein GCM10011379_45200 [Filimonas zeae]